jgi:uncharacterized protein (TIGR03083 family)
MNAVTRVEELSPLTRREAAVLAVAETARMAQMLRSLEPNDWLRPTECPGWDVRAMAGHVLGMVQTFSSVRAMARDMVAGGKAAGDRPLVDGLTDVQVSRNGGATTDQVIEMLEAEGPVQAQWRASRRLMRRIPLKQALRSGTETWRFGYLVDTILTRDTWMHRVDIARATGKPLVLTPEHDGRLVADVVAEWARRHGRPFDLHLSGPAGGHFSAGRDGEQIDINAVEFCRILSGRGEGHGLLNQEVPF